MVERVGLINSNQTTLNNDFDFSAFEGWLTGFTSWVMFSDTTVRWEFGLSWSTSPTVTSGQAIIYVTRATSTPIANQKIPLRYQMDSSKQFLNATSGSKIYIEVTQTLIDNPTLIQDVYPATDYAMGKNIATMNMASLYPSTNTYLKLWEYNDTSWVDVRVMPKLKANRMDFIDADWNFSTEWSITAQDIVALWNTSTNGTSSATNFVSPKWNLQWQIDTLWWLSFPMALYDSTYMAGEAITAWQCVFVESWPTAAQATTKQNIGDVVWNTRVSFPIIWTWVAGNTFKVNICKTGTGHNSNQNLNFRIETDNAGSPSWTLADANATATIAPASLTTSLADTTLTLTGAFTPVLWTKYHIVARQGSSLNYADTIVNATNYYNIWYSLNDTSTRNWWQYNGTSWVSTYSPVTDVATNNPTVQYWGPATYKGMKFTATKDIYLISFLRSTWNTMSARVIDSIWTVLTSSFTISWDTYTLNSPIFFAKWTTFKIELNDAVYGWFYVNTSFPQAKTNITIVSGSDNNSDNTGEYWNITNVITKEVDKKWIYLSSTMAQDQLLSLTDADFAYKLPNLPRISTWNYAIWTYPKCVFAWNTTLLTVSKDTVYYLSWAPWAISTSPWTNSRAIAIGIATNVANLDPFPVWTIWYTGTLPITGIIMASLPTARTATGTYTKVKSATITRSWIYTISYQIWLSYPQNIYVKPYRNWVAYWTEQYYVYTWAGIYWTPESLYYSAWDTLEVWIKGSWSGTCTISNVLVHYQLSNIVAAASTD